MAAVSLWVPVPFYLATVGDPLANKTILEFFNDRLGLGVDLGDMDAEISQQHELIAKLRNDLPDVDDTIKKLENNLTISEEENQKLVAEIEKALNNKT